MKRILSIALFSLLIFQVFGQKIPFQGKLIEAGVPVNASKTLEFALPDLGWSETHANVQVTDGLYFIVLGSINPLPSDLFSGVDERQLSFSVDGTALSPVTLYEPLAADLSEINLKGPENGLLRAAFRTDTEPGKNWPFLSMKGNLEGERLSVGVDGPADGTFETASLAVSNTLGDFSGYAPNSVYLVSANQNSGRLKADQLWFRTGEVFNLQLFNQNWGNKGYAGTILLRGPNSRNLEIGNRHWEDPDLPRIVLRGSKDNDVVELTAVKYLEDGVEKERGVIALQSTDGRNANITSSYFGVYGPEWRQFVYAGTANDGIKGERGIITLSNSSGEETTIEYDGTWGTGPFNMWSGAMVNGTLTVNGDIQGSGTNSYNSDKRLKKDIQPLSSNILNQIESLGGYSYYWKQDEFPEKNFAADQQIGLIAQELEEQFPALVKTGNDGFKSVNYNGFTAVLLQAVKELNAKVEKLESDNQLLQAELSASVLKNTELENLKNQVENLAKLVQEKTASSSEFNTAEVISTTSLK